MDKIELKKVDTNESIGFVTAYDWHCINIYQNLGLAEDWLIQNFTSKGIIPTNDDLLENIYFKEWAEMSKKEGSFYNTMEAFLIEQDGVNYHMTAVMGKILYAPVKELKQ